MTDSKEILYRENKIYKNQNGHWDAPYEPNHSADINLIPEVDGTQYHTGGFVSKGSVIGFVTSSPFPSWEQRPGHIEWWPSIPNERPGWDEYFLDIADVVSKRATCPVRKVGAVFVDRLTNAILTTGYNGAPAGTGHCNKCDGRIMGKGTDVCKVIHAEMNGIINAAKNGVMMDGSKLYCNVSPCLNCARAVVQAGVKEVVYRELYASQKGQEALELLEEGNVEHRQF